MAIHPALKRRAEAARGYQPGVSTKLPRSGHYSAEPVELRRQVQEFERKVAETQDTQGRRADESLTELNQRLGAQISALEAAVEELTP